MTVDKIKHKLHSVRVLKIRLLALQQRIKELEKEIDGISAVNYSKDKVKNSNVNNVEHRIVKQVDRLKALQDEYASLFGDLCDVEDELGECMKRLNPTEYRIIYERFLYGIRPVSIKRMVCLLGEGHSEDMVKKAQQRAFKKMSDEPPPA